MAYRRALSTPARDARPIRIEPVARAWLVVPLVVFGLLLLTVVLEAFSMVTVACTAPDPARPTQCDVARWTAAGRTETTTEPLGELGGSLERAWSGDTSEGRGLRARALGYPYRLDLTANCWMLSMPVASDHGAAADLVAALAARRAREGLTDRPDAFGPRSPPTSDARPRQRLGHAVHPRFARRGTVALLAWLAAAGAAAWWLRTRSTAISVDAARSVVRVQRGRRSGGVGYALGGAPSFDVEHDGTRFVLLLRAGGVEHTLATGARRGLLAAAAALGDAFAAG